MSASRDVCSTSGVLTGRAFVGFAVERSMFPSISTRAAWVLAASAALRSPCLSLPAASMWWRPSMSWSTASPNVWPSLSYNGCWSLAGVCFCPCRHTTGHGHSSTTTTVITADTRAVGRFVLWRARVSWSSAQPTPSPRCFRCSRPIGFDASWSNEQIAALANRTGVLCRRSLRSLRSSSDCCCCWPGPTSTCWRRETCLSVLRC